MVFVSLTALALLFPLQHRWLASLLTGAVLMVVLLLSARRTSRMHKNTDLRCPSCTTVLLTHHADIVVASGACPNCGHPVLEPD
jgi:hypothetical protein